MTGDHGDPKIWENISEEWLNKYRRIEADAELRQRELDELANKHNLPPESLHKIYERIDKSKSPDDSIPPFLALESCVLQGIEFFKGAELIAVLEKEGIEGLMEKNNHTSILKEHERSFLPLTELANTITKFIENLHAHRTRIIEIGHAPFIFPQHEKLELLARTYPTRVPLSVWKERPWSEHRKWMESTRAERLRFLNDTGLPTELHDLVEIENYLREEHEYSEGDFRDPCSMSWAGTSGMELIYEWPDKGWQAAPFIRGLDGKDAIKLEKSRCDLLNVKIHILTRLRDAVLCRDIKNVLRDSIELISGMLSMHGTMEFFCRTDGFYRNYGTLMVTWKGRSIPKLIAGGLLDLLSVIGECIKEIAVGTYCRPREILGDLILNDESRGNRLSSGNYFYFQKCGKHRIIDIAYNEFRKLIDEERNFWPKYLERAFVLLASYEGKREAERERALEEHVLRDIVSISQDTSLTRQLMIRLMQDSEKSRNRLVQTSKEFDHSDDYRTVLLQGRQYYLLSREAQVIQLLHEHYLRGTPGVSQAHIITEVCGSESNSKRVRDIFSDRDTFSALIRSVPGRRGLVQLNIPPLDEPKLIDKQR